MLQRIKWLMYPGINLHARERYRLLPGFFRLGGSEGEWQVLDAGCGNGMLGYQSYLRGATVLGISIKADEVAHCRQLFHGHLGISEKRLRFEQNRIDQVPIPDGSLDEIICSEVIEHIRDDAGTIQRLARMLKPGGVLHLCAPNAAHPDNQSQALDLQESGGHVRCGYTMDMYRTLLEPCGLFIEGSLGLGGRLRQAFNKRITAIQGVAGLAGGIFLFALWIPVSLLEGGIPDVPISLYVKARKRG